MAMALLWSTLLTSVWSVSSLSGMLTSNQVLLTRTAAVFTFLLSYIFCGLTLGMRRPVPVKACTLLRGVRVRAYTLLKDVWISGYVLFNRTNIFWNILVQFS